jgi:hypothetical protein
VGGVGKGGGKPCICHYKHISGQQRAETQLSVESDYFTDYETDEEITTAGDHVMTSVRHDFQDNTWSQDSFTYDPKPREFNGSQGPRSFFAGIPTIL